MSQRLRIVVAILILAVVTAAVLGIDAVRRRRSVPQQGAGQATIEPGSMPIYVDGRLIAGFSPDDLSQLDKASFVDKEEGKTQEGWLLRDVLLLYLASPDLQPDTQITVRSSAREKSAQLTWEQVSDPANSVLFDLSGRGTLKLVSVLDELDVRDEWIQDVDEIVITGAP